MYLLAFRHWFDSNKAFLSLNGVRLPVLRQVLDSGNSIVHAEIETDPYLGEVSLWEYEDGHALVDTDFVNIETGEFHPEHYELYNSQELDALLSRFIKQVAEAR